MLTRKSARLMALLVPRVRAAWPSIGAIALAVVLAHSGVAHLQGPTEIVAHYRAAFGSGEWARTIGILTLLAAGGLCFRRTRVMSAAAFAALLLFGIANQVRTERVGSATLAPLLLLAWTGVVAWGEARRGDR